MSPVIFITDGLIFLLVFMVLGFVFYARGHEHLRAPWRDVARRPIAMSAAIFLSIYIVIGLLDSLHFHPELEATDSNGPVYSSEISSVLDILLGNLRNDVERTYSAPLASYAFSKEMLEQPDGSQIRTYPRLKYGGAHLDDPETESTADITKRTLVSMCFGLLMSLVIIGLIIFIINKRNMISLKETISKCASNEFPVPWYAIFITLTLIITVISCVAYLSQSYHVFGTDKVGQDVLYQTLKSIRTGLVIGTLTTLVMLPFAIMTGLMAGYFRGWIDDVIQYLYTTLNSIPGVLLIAASILLLQVYISNQLRVT